MNTKEENNKDIQNLCNLAAESYKIPAEIYNSYDVKRGLRNLDGSGVLAGLTQISEVHGFTVSEGEKTASPGTLSYRGYDISDLALKCGLNKRYGFEEVCFLLLEGKLPTKPELNDFIEILKSNMTLPDSFAEDMILKAPSADIMNKLARNVLSLYSYDANPDECSTENVLLQCIELIARMPVLAAYAYRAKKHYYDNKSLILHNPRPDYSIAENILHMLRTDNKFTQTEAEILDLSLILHAEHGGGNNSSFTCRVLSSSGTDTYSAISGAICSLKGPKHGGANVKVVNMMKNIKSNVADWENEDEVYEYLSKIVKKQANDHSGLIYGMGHAVYTLSDPRTALLKEKAVALCVSKEMEKELKLYELVEKLAPAVFRNVKNDSKVISANVDFYSGFVYKMLNIPEEMYTPLFAIARCPGWCAHRLEEMISGGRILRPAYKSICRNSKEYVDLEDR